MHISKQQKTFPFYDASRIGCFIQGDDDGVQRQRQTQPNKANYE